MINDIETWIFDLDNTLYSVSDEMHGQIDDLLGGFVSEFLKVDRIQARTIQKAYFKEFGLTLRGLMVNHDLDPEVYFDYMTREELYDMEPDPGLSSALARLPGRKMVYTNAPGRHAELALTRLGLSDHFEAVYDIQAAGFVPKPAIGAYSELCRLHGIDPAKAVMVDDIITNLEPAAKLGMTTVWMKTSAEWAQDIEVADYVDHVTQDLAGWIDGLLAGG